MASDQAPNTRTRYWQTASELPPEIFEVWRKLHQALNPISIVATCDRTGAPHAAPFGSMRAITPQLLRFASWRGHDTFANLCRDGRVMVTLLAPPDMAVSVQGRARVVKEQMCADESYVVIDIDIEQVKNDMVRSVIIESAVTISAKAEYQPWFQRVLSEVEDM
jgi:hypothetical protein